MVKRISRGVWSKRLKQEIDKNDKAFDNFLNKNKIKSSTFEAHKAWRSSGFQLKQNKIFNKFKNK